MKTPVLIMAIALAAVFSFAGCKDKPAAPQPQQNGTAEAADAVSDAAQPADTEQTTCPVMGGAINKEIFTEYKGKKVYFCCPACKPEFEKNPEKYISKLPQFKNAQQ